MTGSDEFKKVIDAHLKDRAISDPLFAETLKKPNKSIDECVSYILDTVKKSGKAGFADDEIFGMAVHYYDEDSIKVKGSTPTGQVIINRSLGKAKEDKKQAAPKSPKKEKFVPKSAPKKQSQQITRPSLFD